MFDKPTHQDRLKGILHTEGKPDATPKKVQEDDTGEASCAAFGYLRGIRERADAIEIRLRDGNSTWFPYGWLGNWKFNPSEGLLLKFSGDLVYLVLIKGSNLDRPLTDSTINLTSAGLQRHLCPQLRPQHQTVREHGNGEIVCQYSQFSKRRSEIGVIAGEAVKGLESVDDDGTDL